jgi:hypothetical protein
LPELREHVRRWSPSWRRRRAGRPRRAGSSGSGPGAGPRVFPSASHTPQEVPPKSTSSVSTVPAVRRTTRREIGSSGVMDRGLRRLRSVWKEPLQDAWCCWPSFEDHFARHLACRVAERQRNYEHVVERADDRQELGDQVDRRQHPQPGERHRDLCSTRYARIAPEPSDCRGTSREHGGQVLRRSRRELSSEDRQECPGCKDQTNRDQQESKQVRLLARCAHTHRMSSGAISLARTYGRRLSIRCWGCLTDPGHWSLGSMLGGSIVDVPISASTRAGLLMTTRC